jgi:hypothetical protein
MAVADLLGEGIGLTGLVVGEAGEIERAAAIRVVIQAATAGFSQHQVICEC